MYWCIEKVLTKKCIDEYYGEYFLSESKLAESGENNANSGGV